MEHYVQHLAITYNGKQSAKEIELSHFAVPLGLTQDSKSTILQQ